MDPCGPEEAANSTGQGGFGRAGDVQEERRRELMKKHDLRRLQAIIRISIRPSCRSGWWAQRMLVL